MTKRLIEIDHRDFTVFVEVSNKGISIIALKHQVFSVFELDNVSVFEINRSDYHAVNIAKIRDMLNETGFANQTARFLFSSFSNSLFSVLESVQNDSRYL